MKRWNGALVVALLCCLRLFFARDTRPALLQDSDTRFLLEQIAARNAPLSWFGSDWPLQNHFYRPVSTLAFEMDRRLYGSQAWGYGLTNVLLCIACTLLLFWYLRELTDRPWLVAGSVALFTCWQAFETWIPLRIAELFTMAVLAGGLLRHGKRVSLWVPAALVAWEVVLQIQITQPLGSTTIEWLPGRTATVMAFFALAATTAYARYERLTAVRSEAVPTPLDPPATRSTKAPRAGHGSPFAVGWAILSVVCLWLALASYEQAVMVPAILLATAVCLRWQGFRVRWGWQAIYWLSLGGYLVLRHQMVPSDASTYQLQQFRTGPGVWLSLATYSFPCLFSIPTIPGWFDQMPMIFFIAEPWRTIASFGSDVATFMQGRLSRQCIFLASGWGMALIAYLPMAWLKQFGHYHYWPEAFKALFVASLAWLAWDLALTGWSPQTRQAPPRRDPAPGSLPRP